MKKRYVLILATVLVMMGSILSGCGGNREISMQALASANKISKIREYYGVVKVTNDSSLNDFVTTEYIDDNAVYHREDDHVESVTQGSGQYFHHIKEDVYEGYVFIGQAYEDERNMVEYQVCHPEFTPLEEILEQKTEKNEIFLKTKYTPETQGEGFAYAIIDYTLDKNTCIAKESVTTEYNDRDEVISTVKITVEKAESMPEAYYEMQNRLNAGGETRDVTFMNTADGIGFGTRVRKGEPVYPYLYEDYKLYKDRECTDEYTGDGDLNESVTLYLVVEE